MPLSNQMSRQLRAIYDLLGIEDATAFAEKNPERIVHWLYRILDTLDSKTSHLLRLNALIIVAQSFLVNGILGSAGAPGWVLYPSIIFVLIPTLGAGFALWVFRVAWPFLNWQNEKEPFVTDLDRVKAGMREEFVALAEVCDKRTHMHQIVWWFTLVSICLLVPSLIIRYVVV